ncbi:MFS transporter [Virgisporangium aliadipatigenens]|nr:MFS transporter [Virgisporangium aliadipatigenens]
MRVGGSGSPGAAAEPDAVGGATGVRVRRGVGVLAGAAIVLAALNLRPAVTSIGPVLAELRADLGMSAAVAGLLTSVPVACFALVGFAAPRLARRVGAVVAVAAGTVATAVGVAARPFAPGTAAFVAWSVLALAGIAVVNVLLPAVVKEFFPARVGRLTGLYSMALNLGAATAAAATVPIAHAAGGSWRSGLGAWAVLAVLAVPPWLALTRTRTARARNTERASVARHPVAWALAVYFGLQATAAYVVIGWLPQMFRDAGIPQAAAGLLFSMTAVLGVPLSLLLSAVVDRMRGQSALAAVLCGFGLCGYAGLYAAPAAAPWLWAVLLGVANCSFPLALTMIGLRGSDGARVVALSAFAQGTGYLLSIPGPLVVGALYGYTGDWRWPLAFLVALMVPQCVAGIFAGRDRPV